MLGEASLNRYGYPNVKIFEDGQAALDAIKEAIDKGEKTPDLIITDVNMPRMGGGQLLEEIEKLGLPIAPTAIYLTGRSDPANVQKVKERAYKGLAKPYLPRDQMLPLVEEALQYHFREETS